MRVECYSYLGPISDAQHEADGVQDVGFTGAVESCNGIELWIPASDRCTCGIALEAVDDQFLDAHRCLKC